MSYAKVRALTRVATAETDTRLVEIATDTTGAQLERLCRRFRSVRDDVFDLPSVDADFGEGAADRGGRGLRIRALPSGQVRLEITLQPDEADLVVQAIEKARELLRDGARPGAADTESSHWASPLAGQSNTQAPARGAAGAPKANVSAETSREPPPLTESSLPAGGLGLPMPGRADGLVFIAKTVLSSDLASVADNSVPNEAASVENAPPRPWASDRYQVFIHLDQSLMGRATDWEAFLDDGTRISAETFRRVSCDGGLVGVQAAPGDGVLSIGRRTRTIPPAIRRALWLRDQGCRFPGCTNRRFVHGHHIRHWAHGGATSVDNLVLLCSFHHGLVHEGGFRLQRDSEDRPRAKILFIDPRGRIIPELGDRLEARSASTGAPPALRDPEVNACGWDGEPIDEEAILDDWISGRFANDGPAGVEAQA